MSSTDTPTEIEPSDSPEVDEARSQLLERFRSELGSGLVESHLVPGDDLWVRVDREAWLHAAEFSKSALGFAYFNFLSGIDWLPSPFGREMDAQVDLLSEQSADAVSPPEGGSKPAAGPPEGGDHPTGGDTRFQIFARLNDIVNALGVTFKVDVGDTEPSVASWVSVYPGANWHERECWEMFGVTFEGHPGLRHLYLPGEFEGYPLRKDYPLLARRMKPWPGIVDSEQMPGDDQ